MVNQTLLLTSNIMKFICLSCYRGEEESQLSLTSAFVALPDVAQSTRGSGLVMSWQQPAGILAVAGNSSTIRLWDLSREQVNI
jgi:hypothetical protein